jgi:hypothetical protein
VIYTPTSRDVKTTSQVRENKPSFFSAKRKMRPKV